MNNCILEQSAYFVNPGYSSCTSKSYPFAMALNSTIWPSIGTAPEAIKTWLCTFYRLVDTNDSSVIEQTVDLFSEDAIVKTAAGQTKGKEGMLRVFHIV